MLETRDDLDRLTSAVASLTSAVHQLADPRPLLQPITDAVEDLARNQIDMLSQFRALYAEASEDRAHIRSTLKTLGALVDRSSALDGTELHRQLDRMIVLEGELAEAAPAAVEALKAAPPLPLGPVSAVAGRQGWFSGFGGPDRRSLKALREARGLRREVREALAANRQAVREVGTGIEHRLQRLADTAAGEQEVVARLESAARDHKAALETLAETLEYNLGVDVLPRVPARPYTGARAAMLALRQRLQAAFDPREPLRSDDAAADPAERPRRSGTSDKGDL